MGKEQFKYVTALRLNYRQRYAQEVENASRTAAIDNMTLKVLDATSFY